MRAERLRELRVRSQIAVDTKVGDHRVGKRGGTIRLESARLLENILQRGQKPVPICRLASQRPSHAIEDRVRRPRAGFFYATGDDSPRDRDASGFDSIFDAQTFAGGGFSFFNRLGLRLAGSGLALVERGSLLPSLRSSKLEGQPNFVNPGLQLATAGFDVDVTPRLKTTFTANYLRFDKVQSLEAVLFQDRIRRELGTDLSIGFIYRPYLNNNVVVVLGGAAFLPAAGFTDIYEKDDTLFHVFTNLTFTF